GQGQRRVERRHVAPPELYADGIRLVEGLRRPAALARDELVADPHPRAAERGRRGCEESIFASTGQEGDKRSGRSQPAHDRAAHRRPPMRTDRLNSAPVKLLELPERTSTFP